MRNIFLKRTGHMLMAVIMVLSILMANVQITVLAEELQEGTGGTGETETADSGWSVQALTDSVQSVAVVNVENVKSAVSNVTISASILDASGKSVETKEKAVDIAQGETESLIFRSEQLNKVGKDGYTFSASVKGTDETGSVLQSVTALEPDEAPLANKNPETFCNPINISYPYQGAYSNNAFRMLADAQPVYYKGEYWLFPTKASGYFHSKDLINWEFVYSVSNQTNSNAPGTFVYNDYLYIGRYDARIYRSNNPADPDSWEIVRNTNYPDPYFFLDTDAEGKEHLYVLHGCTGLNASNTDTEPIVYLMELDLTSPTLAELPVDTTINEKAVNGKGYPIIYMEREHHGYEVPGQMNDNYDPDADSWLEGAGMIKHNNKYYVYYSGPSTECAAYGEGCYVSDSPFGPYEWCDSSPFAYKSTGFTVGAGHGHDVVEQNSGRIWKFGSVCVPNYYHWERRMNLYPVDFNKYDQPVTDLSVSDYPMYVPTSAKSTAETQGPDWNLVSYGITAEASSTHAVTVTPTNKDPNIAMMDPFTISPDKAFDESMRTWWSAETGNAGEWLKGDMGKIKTVHALQLNFADQDTGKMKGDARESTDCYRYLIEYSVDGTTWMPLVDRSNRTAEAYKAQDTSHDYFELLEPVEMRYIRVTNKGKVPRGKFAISGLRLFGSGGKEAPAEAEEFELSRIDGADGRSVQVSWNAVSGAEGYIIRYGTHEDQLNIHHQAIGTTSARINALTANKKYYFRIDTYNDSGRTIGTTVKELEPLVIEATGVTLDKTSLTLEAEESETLKAQIAPANATNRKNTWESSAPDVAVVENGTVTAKSAGKATITVTTANGRKASCEVTVTESAPGPSEYTIVDSDTGEIRWDLAGFSATVKGDGVVSQAKYAKLAWLTFSTEAPASYWVPEAKRIEMYGGYIAFTPSGKGTLYVTGASKKNNNGRYISVVTDPTKPDSNQIITQSETSPVEKSVEVEKDTTYYICANGAYMTEIRYVPSEPTPPDPDENLRVQMEEAIKEIQIPNADNVRGNITLLSETSNGVKVSWSSSDEAIVSTKTIKNENYDDTPAGVVKRDENEDKDVILTATLKLENLTETKTIPLTVKKAPDKLESQDYKGYLFASFTGEDTDTGEQIFFSTSKDGFHWEDLNDTEPVLTSNLGEQGVRDPFIMRSAEGDRFYIVATDLKIYGKGKGAWDNANYRGSKSIIIWESDDLVNWSEPRMVKIAADNAGCTWAPEFIYDEKTGEYFVYWASMVQNEGESKALQKVYYAKTRDFYTFTEPKLYISKTDHILDTTIIRDGDWYYRISNDGTASRIKIEKGRNLLGGASEFMYMDTPALDTLEKVEGPAAFKLNGTNQWCLMVDRSGADLGYLPLVTEDISSGEFRILNDSEFSMGAKKRHGAVINLTQAEYDAVMEKWKNSTDKTALNAAVKEAEGKNSVEYTAESFQALKAALEEARKVSADKTADQSQIDKALKDLQDAVEQLVPAAATGEFNWDIAGHAGAVTGDTTVSKAEYDDLPGLTFSTADPLSYWVPENRRIEMYGGYIAFTPSADGMLYVTGASKKNNNNRYISVVADYNSPESNKILTQSETSLVKKGVEVKKGSTCYIVGNGVYITEISYVPLNVVAQKDLNALQVPATATRKITLPTKGEYGSDITWNSSDTSVIAVDGTVTRPESGDSRTVTLTATVTFSGGEPLSKTFTVTVKPMPGEDDDYGYLMVHFIEDANGYAEKIYLDISREDNPQQWDPLNGGKPILTSNLGTTGVRDPYLTYNPETKTYYIIATDLRVFGGDGDSSDESWAKWQKNYSTKMNVWESKDLISWSDVRQFDVALNQEGQKQANLGMMWAPEATWVPDYYGEGKGAFVVYWSSSVFRDEAQTDQDSISDIMWGVTTDFTQETWKYGGKFLDGGAKGWIDTTIIQNGDKTYHITKTYSEEIVMEVTTDKTWWLETTNWTRVQSRIGKSRYGVVEGPAVFKDQSDDSRWYLFVDDVPSPGYRPMISTDLDKGWDYLDSEDYFLTANTKHGGVISLTRKQYQSIRNADAVSVVETELGEIKTKAGTEADDLLNELPETARVNLAYNQGIADLPVIWDISAADLTKAGTYTVTGTVQSIAANKDQWKGRQDSTAYDAEEKQLYSSGALKVSCIVSVGGQRPTEADKTALNAKITEAEGKDASLYTEESYKSLADALETAKEISGNKEATQAQVDEAAGKLDTAIKALQLIQKPGEEKPDMKKPGTPSSVKASWTGKKNIKITWKQASDAEQYIVYRSYKKSSGFKKIAAVTKLSYTDKSAKEGKKVYYKVIAQKGNLQGAFSKTVSAYRIKKPSKIKAKAKKGGVTISFARITKASGYQIYRASKKNGKYKKTASIKAGKAKTVKKTFEKLKKGTYYYKVRAYQTSGKKKVYTDFSKAVKVNVR